MTPASVIEAPERAAAPRTVARIAVLGASGYAGQEFVRIALGHPGLALAALVSREHAGRPASDLLPGLDARLAGLPDVTGLDGLMAAVRAGEVDTLVACLPHGALAAVFAERPALANVGRIVDLSADHRDEAEWRYGLPEAFRATLAGATRIANPGCYPTAATLALLPALETGLLAGPVTVTALSGVSGAGRAPTLRTSFVELDGGAALYKAGEVHAHVGEMRRSFERLSGHGAPVAFFPQLAPMARGILLTATATLRAPMPSADAHALWAVRFQDEAFVQVLEPGTWPETRAVRNSNRCDVAVVTVHDGRTLVATAAIDNLVKGAAGQAVQNLNLLLGWPEAWGLPVHGNPW